MSYESVDDHRSMVMDRTRNEAYEAAMRDVVAPSSVVMDLGSGLGIHGLLAARLGARRVYMVEPEDIVALGERIAVVNGLADRLVHIRSRVEDIDDLEPADVIVSVLAGNFLLTEDLFPSLIAARDRFLAPGGTMIPSRAAMEVAPICSNELHGKYVGAWSKPHCGLDFSPVRELAANTVRYPRLLPADVRRLAPAAVLAEYDFLTMKDPGCDAEVEFRIRESGTCHGILGWFRMLLGRSWLSTDPVGQTLHWSPAWLPLDPPVEVTRNQIMVFRLVRPVRGEWSWSVEGGACGQSRSTFLSRALTDQSLAMLVPDHVPVLDERGRAIRMVLSCIDGHTSVEDIAARLGREFPPLFGNPGAALAYVQWLLAGLARASPT